MLLNVTEINDLLAKCSNPVGTSLPSDLHWSSSEFSAHGAWNVDFSIVYVRGSNGYSKEDSFYVRFCRDLN